MKVSIIMPTYNDESTIENTLDSVMEQTYKDIELIIVDDGSTDGTKKVIENYKNKKDIKDIIKYIYQENQDQLNAILNGLNYVTGEYIHILHSDDLINEKNSIQKCVEYMENNKQIESIIGDLIIIDKDGNVTGKQTVKNFKNKECLIPLQLLWLGRNLYIDVGFHRKDTYINKIKENYLKWNTPFWINFNEDITLLNVQKVNFSFYKYRVFEENYINEYSGQLNVINGELRTAIKIMKKYSIPFYRFQYFLFRVFNKLKLEYIPIYIKKEEKDKKKIIKFIIKKRFKEKYKENRFLDALVKYYSIKSDRIIEINENIEKVYMGKDIRVFNKKLLNNELESFYINMLEDMSNGFKKIIVKNKEQKEKVQDICSFLCIDPIIGIK